MRFSEIKNHKESMGLLFWQVSMLWQRKIKKVLQAYDLTHTQFVILAVIEELTEQDNAKKYLRFFNDRRYDCIVYG